MELWARLLLYNFCSIITGHVVISRKGRKHQLQVNYSVAYKVCHYFLRIHNGESPPDVEGLIEKNTLPIRPDRKYARQHGFQSALRIVFHKAGNHNTDSIHQFEADVYPSICGITK